MKKLLLFLFFAAISLLLLSSPSQATLIGDEITASASINPGFLTPSSATIHEGDIEFEYNAPFSYWLDIDFDMDTLSITVYALMMDMPANIPSEVFRFEQFDETLEDVSIISTDILDGTVAIDSIGEHEFSLSFTNVRLGFDTLVQAQILTREQSTPVPEPATVLLLGTGLVGLVGFRKKFKM